MSARGPRGRGPAGSEPPLSYQETQRFTQWWLWLLLGGTAAGAWIMALRYLLGEPPAGTGSQSGTAALVTWALLGVAVPLLFAAIHLRTEVRGDGVRVRLFPFHWRFRDFPFETIATAEARKYSPIREYGGWGLRFGPSGWAYNVKGDQGVQLVLTSGKKILIGTQHPRRLAEAIAAGRRS